MDCLVNLSKWRPASGGFPPKTVTKVKIFRKPIKIEEKFSQNFPTFSSLVRVSGLAHVQCDQIGQFLKKFLAKNLFKIAQTFSDFMGKFEKHNFFRKTALPTFWATFGGNWATF